MKPVVEFPFNEEVKRTSKVIVRIEARESDNTDNFYMVRKARDGNRVMWSVESHGLSFPGRRKRTRVGCMDESLS